MSGQLTGEQIDWAGRFCGMPDLGAASPSDDAKTASDDAGGMTAATPDGAPYSAQGAAPASSQSAPPGDSSGGMTGVTPDGAPYSAQGAAPDGSQSPPPAPGDGGMTAATPDGAPYSAQGAAPASSQPPPSGDTSGGMTGVTPDGVPYSAQGTGPNSSQQGDAPQDSTSPDPDERPLTSDEIRYAKDIFQDTLDYGVITITRDELGSAGSTRTIGNTINFQLSEFNPGTFVLSPDGKNTLIHEMTHVWQYQHQGWTYAPAALWAQLKAAVATGSRNAAYDWRALDNAGTPWDEWNPEAQAEAVEDYNKALRAAQSGSAGAGDYSELSLLQKYIDQMLAGPPKGAAPDAGTDGGGGMTGVTPDGAPYSTQGSAPNASQSPPAGAAEDGGGKTGVTPDGVPYSAPGSAPDASQSTPTSTGADSGGGMTGVTPDGAPYSASGSASDEMKSPPPDAGADAGSAGGGSADAGSGDAGSGSASGAGAGSGDAGAQPKPITTKITAPAGPSQPLKHEDAVRVWGVDAVGNYTQGWKGGKQPAPLQAGVNLTFPTITIDVGSKGNWDFSALNQPQIGLALDKGGVSGQAAINLFQAVWKDKYGPRLEADLQATITNLKLDENPQFGGMVQVELKLNETWGVTAFLQSQSDEKANKDFETNFSGGFGVVVHILKGPK